MAKSDRFHLLNARRFNSLLENPYLKAVRNGLTLTLPLVMAGSLAVLIANFPLASYSSLMERFFGENWRELCTYIQNGAFNILSLVMVVTISHSLAEYHNSKPGAKEINPAVVSLVSLASLIALIQPMEGNIGLPFFWLGIHGLFIAIIVAFAATTVFMALRRIPWLHISFYSEEADPSIPHAFSAMFPGLITIVFFAGIKTLSAWLGVDDLHQAFYDMLSKPFAEMGNTFWTAQIYTLVRHVFWFFGIHGSNLMEPVTTAIYIPAMDENIAAVAAGLEPVHIFSKTFFDVFVAMGGSGSTICLIIACFLFSRQGSMRKVSQLSFIPALFNINEIMIFGFPIVLNPVIVIPFILVPAVIILTTYLAMLYGLVPVATHPVDWTATIFVSGYTATGSLAGSALQAFNIVLGVAIYTPFVRLADRMKKELFNAAFKELLPGYTEGLGAESVLSPEARALSRSITSDLQEAVERKELSLEYQPQVDSLTGRVFGVEALVRWNHSHLGRIPPGLFITLAEEAGFIKKIGSWVLDEACHQLALWRQHGLSDVTMSINLSVHQLDDLALVDELDRIIAGYGLPARNIEVEVTESSALGPESDKTEILQRIHELGVRLAIDDFGMGHSSLVYLKQFPVDTIKLDRVLTKDVVASRYSTEIIFTIAELSHTLKITPLAEYVDNIEQLKALQSLGCTYIQGYLFSPPLSADDAEAFIRAGAKIY